MTYTPLQIEIIKKFGRKDLEFGCLFYPNDDDFRELYKYVDRSNWRRVKDGLMSFPGTDDGDTNHYGEILGHLPHLEDIFRVAKDKDFDLFQVVYHDKMWSTESQQGIFMIDNMGKSVRIPYNSTLPLIEQDESTLSQLLSLFK